MSSSVNQRVLNRGRSKLWRLAILGLVLSLPLLDYPVPAFSAIRIPTLVAAVVVATGLLTLSRRSFDLRLVRKFVGSPLNWLLIFFWLSQISILGLFNATNAAVLEFLKSDANLLLFSLLALCFVINPLELDDLWIALRLQVALGLVLGFHGILQFVAVNLGIRLPLVDGEFVHFGALSIIRTMSVFSEPGHFAVFLSRSLLILLVARNSEYTVTRSRFWDVIGLVVLSLAILTTLSMRPFLTLVPGALMVWAGTVKGKGVASRKILRWILLVAVVTLLVSLVNPMLVREWGNRIVYIITYVIKYARGQQAEWVQGESIGGRLASIAAGLDLWSKSPVWGVGLGNYRFFHRFYGISHGAFLDSWYVTLLAETGVLGFGGFVAWMGSLWLALNRAPVGLQGAKEKTIADTLYVGLVAQLALFLASNSFFAADVWLVFGLAFAFLALRGKSVK